MSWLDKLRLRTVQLWYLVELAFRVLLSEGPTSTLKKTYGFVSRHVVKKSTDSLRYHLSKTDKKPHPSNLPLVTFIIPVFDRTGLLREAIESVLAQTIQNFELILVSDGSPPETLEVLESYQSTPRVKIFHFDTSSGNAVRGRNKGIAEAQGKYIAFLDSDDIAHPQRLELSLPLLEGNVADVVYGGWRAIVDGSRAVEGLKNGQLVLSPDLDKDLLFKACVPCQSTVMVRRSSLQEAGYLKPIMEYREDHELWLRLLHFGARFRAVQGELVQLRLHDGNNELNFKGDDVRWRSALEKEYTVAGPKPVRIAYIMQSVGIGGGSSVVLKHMELLSNLGADVFIINLSNTGDIAWYGNKNLRQVHINDFLALEQVDLDAVVATFWSTVEWLQKIPAKNRFYLVQSDERLFYESEVVKKSVSETYELDIQYLAISKWLQEMLLEEFGQDSILLPNGLEASNYLGVEPRVPKQKGNLRILIEGPISIPFKGVKDAYRAVEGMGCEIWLVSSDGQPSAGWNIDEAFLGVPSKDMAAIYASCDILLKMSRVESFAYPPLEAMASGCAVVVSEVEGSIEYLLPGENALVVGKRDIIAARRAVQKLVDDPALRRHLVENGLRTAQEWTWNRTEAELKALADRLTQSQST